MKTCFFIGHRDAPAEIMPKLEHAIEQAFSGQGITHFLVGHYGNFDRMAADAVIRVKKKHPEIMLHLLLPYRSADHKTFLPESFNGVFCPFHHAPADSAAIPVANKYAINHCDLLIAYACHEGNSRGFLEYALSRGTMQIQNLAE